MTAEERAFRVREIVANVLGYLVEVATPEKTLLEIQPHTDNEDYHSIRNHLNWKMDICLTWVDVRQCVTVQDIIDLVERNATKPDGVAP